MTPVNSSVKMSSYEGDSFIERQRTTAGDGIERGRARGADGEAGGRIVGLSVRQVRRLLAAYRKEGIAALAHGNRGRGPVHTISDDTRRRVVALAQGRYSGLNHYQLQELLLEREGLALSRSSVWRILSAAGLSSPRRRRPPQHRCRRERFPQEGMLLQLDGQPFS
mgnify:FL=1